MSQWLKVLAEQSWGPGFKYITHIKKPGMAMYICHSSAVEDGVKRLTGIAGCQSSSRLSEKVSQGSKSERSRLGPLTCSSGLHVCTGICTWLHRYAYTFTYNEKIVHWIKCVHTNMRSKLQVPSTYVITGQDGPPVVATHGRWRKGMLGAKWLSRQPHQQVLLLSERPWLKEWR